MLPMTTAISAPIPPGMDFTVGFGPALLLLVAALVVSAFAILYAAISARRLPEVRVEPRPSRTPAVRRKSHPLTA